MKSTGYPSIDKLHLQGIPEEKLHPTVYPLSMLATFLQINSTHLDETAIEDTEGKKHTKSDVKNDTVNVSGLLLSNGINPGDTIAIMLQNCYEGIIIILAANAIGVKVAMFEPNLASNPTLLQKEIETHKPKAIFGYNLSLTDLKPNPHLSQSEVMAEIERHNMSTNDEPMIYLKTSGSTSGIPKSLPFSNRAIFAALIYAANSTGTKTRDESVNRVLCNAPYQHGYGWMTLFVNLLGGNQVVLAGGKEEDIAKYYSLKPSYIYGTPLALKQFMRLTPQNADLSSITAFFCAGAALPEIEYEEGIAYFRAHNSKAEIRNNYGISEGLCIGTASDGITHKPGTVGKFYVGPEWLIVDENLNEVKYGETGELIVSAESLCQGYFNDKKATDSAFIKRNNKTFFRTGDYLSLSEDGYVKFVGRNRRFFFAEGVTDKVNCETIEQALDNLKEVDGSAVIIKKYDNTTEGARAFVVKSTDVSEQEIREHLSKALQPYQMPREIFFIDQIPYMGSGKIDYKSLESI